MSGFRSAPGVGPGTGPSMSGIGGGGSGPVAPLGGSRVNQQGAGMFGQLENIFNAYSMGKLPTSAAMMQSSAMTTYAMQQTGEALFLTRLFVGGRQKLLSEDGFKPVLEEDFAWSEGWEEFTLDEIQVVNTSEGTAVPTSGYSRQEHLIRSAFKGAGVKCSLQFFDMKTPDGQNMGEKIYTEQLVGISDAYAYTMAIHGVFTARQQGCLQSSFTMAPSLFFDSTDVQRQAPSLYMSYIWNNQLVMNKLRLGFGHILGRLAKASDNRLKSMFVGSLMLAFMEEAPGNNNYANTGKPVVTESPLGDIPSTSQEIGPSGNSKIRAYIVGGPRVSDKNTPDSQLINPMEDRLSVPQFVWMPSFVDQVDAHITGADDSYVRITKEELARNTVCYVDPEGHFWLADSMHDAVSTNFRGYDHETVEFAPDTETMGHDKFKECAYLLVNPRKMLRTESLLAMVPNSCTSVIGKVYVTPSLDGPNQMLSCTTKIRFASHIKRARDVFHWRHYVSGGIADDDNFNFADNRDAIGQMFQQNGEESNTWVAIAFDVPDVSVVKSGKLPNDLPAELQLFTGGQFPQAGVRQEQKYVIQKAQQLFATSMFDRPLRFGKKLADIPQLQSLPNLHDIFNERQLDAQAFAFRAATTYYGEDGKPIGNASSGGPLGPYFVPGCRSVLLAQRSTPYEADPTLHSQPWARPPVASAVAAPT